MEHQPIDNETLLRTLIERDGSCLKQGSARLRDDDKMVMLALQRYGKALEFASERLRDNNDIVKIACQNDIYALEFASARLRDNDDFMKIYFQRNGDSLVFASDRLKDNLDMIKICRNSKHILRFVSSRIYNDIDIIKELVQINGTIIYMSDSYRDNYDIVKLAFKTPSGQIPVLKYVSERLRDHEEIVKLGLQKSSHAMKYVSARLRDNEDIAKGMIIAPYIDNPGFKYLSERLRDNDALVLQAVQRNGLWLEFASERLRDDMDIAKIAVEQNGDALKFVSQRLQNNDDIVFTACHLNDNCLDEDFNKFRGMYEPDIFMLMMISNGRHKSTDDSPLMYANERFRDNEVLVRHVIKKSPQIIHLVSDRVQKLIRDTGSEPSKYESNTLVTTPVITTPAVTKNVFKESLIKLKSMIGLTKVKTAIYEQLAYAITMADKTKHTPPMLHTIITGVPGVGKSAIANIIANLLASISSIRKHPDKLSAFKIPANSLDDYIEKLIASDIVLGPTDPVKFVKASRDDLIGKYSGHTAIKTKNVIKSAIGGVLYIDEAYQIINSDDGRDSFGRECLTTLNEAMSEHPDDLIVIFSGYDDAMETLFKTQPGLQRRFTWEFFVDPYSPNEIAQIFVKQMTDDDWVLESSLEDITKLIIDNPTRFSYYGGSTLQWKYFSILSYSCNKLLTPGTDNYIITQSMLEHGLNRLKHDSTCNTPDMSLCKHMYG
jgi:hypothetical protein